MNKKLSISYIAAFLLLMVIPTAAFRLFGSWIDKTNYEQRTLAEKPEFSINEINAYPSSYEAYFNDNLPFRTQFIELDSLIKYFVFQESPSDRVVLGEDGWLFYNPGGVHYNPMADYCGQSTISQEEMVQAAQKLVQARDQLAALGKEFVVMLTPNKECIYSDKIPAEYPKAAEETRCDQLVAYLREHTDLSVVYPKEQLLEAIKDYPEYSFYYKTDTHWNYLGAYVGAKALLSELGIEMPELSEISIEKIDYTGDLAGMMGLTKYLNYDWDYAVSGYSSGKDVQLEFIGENFSDPTKYLGYTAKDADQRKLCVLRDSYTTAMTPYLTSMFSESVLLHRGIYTPELLAEIDADVVVLQVVERELESFLQFTVDVEDAA